MNCMSTEWTNELRVIREQNKWKEIELLRIVGDWVKYFAYYQGNGNDDDVTVYFSEPTPYTMRNLPSWGASFNVIMMSDDKKTQTQPLEVCVNLTPAHNRYEVSLSAMFVRWRNLLCQGTGLYQGRPMKIELIGDKWDGLFEKISPEEFGRNVYDALCKAARHEVEELELGLEWGRSQSDIVRG